MWDANIWAWIDMRCDLDVDGGGTEHRWSLDANFQTWKGVRWHLVGAETRILRPGRRWEGASLEVRCKSRDLDQGLMLPGQRSNTNIDIWVGLRWDLDWVEVHIIRPEYGEMGLGWSWDVIFWTWMDVGCKYQAWMCLRLDLDGAEMQFSGPGWRWDVT